MDENGVQGMKPRQLDSLGELWFDWLLHRRQADDPEYDRVVRRMADGYADRVLDGARLVPGMTLADIGSGEGLVAFRAIDRVGPSLRVLLTDTSESLLRHAETLAIKRGVRSQCTFLHCGAEQLDGIDDASVDVVTTRSVLAYVSDKRAALREFHRVLKPGGRLSLAEPVFRDDAFLARALKETLDAQPHGSQDRFMSLVHRWKAAQYPDTEEKISRNPMTNYSERELVRFAQDCGFAEIHLELHIDLLPFIFTSWEAFLDSTPHPWAPALRVILEERFTSEERQFFEGVLRPAVESGQSPTVERMAYLTAGKPSA